MSRTAKVLCIVAGSAGTWMPLLAVILFVASFLDALDGSFDWERLAAFSFACITLPAGIVSLFLMMRGAAKGGHPSFFLVSMFYKAVFVWLTFVATLGRSYVILNPDHLPNVSNVGEAVIFGMLVDAALSLGILNVCLFLALFAAGQDMILQACDPVPFRTPIRWLIGRFSK